MHSWFQATVLHLQILNPPKLELLSINSDAAVPTLSQAAVEPSACMCARAFCLCMSCSSYNNSVIKSTCFRNCFYQLSNSRSFLTNQEEKGRHIKPVKQVCLLFASVSTDYAGKQYTHVCLQPHSLTVPRLLQHCALRCTLRQDYHWTPQWG